MHMNAIKVILHSDKLKVVRLDQLSSDNDSDFDSHFSAILLHSLSIETIITIYWLVKLTLLYSLSIILPEYVWCRRLTC